MGCWPRTPSWAAGGAALAKKIAGNAALSNYAILSAISRIADMSATDGLSAEGLVMAMIQQGRDVQQRLGDFVSKASKVQLAL